MKKYLSFILVVALSLGILSGCSQKDNPQDSVPTTENGYVRQEPQYHTKYFNVKMLEEQMSHTAAIEIEKENLKKIRTEMNNGVIDTSVLNGTLVFLTPTKICFAHETLSAEIYDIERGNNTKIAYVDLQLLVLQNSKGEYSFFRFNIDTQKYEKFDLENFNPETNEHIVGDSELSMNFLHVIKAVDKEGITTQTYKIEYDYMENKVITSNYTQTYKFDIPFDTNVKEYYLSSDRENLGCVILLENNEMYFVTAKYGYEAEGKLSVKPNCIQNVKSVRSTTSEDKVIVTKENDDFNLYIEYFSNDWNTQSGIVYETPIALNEGGNKFTVNDILKIHYRGLETYQNVFFEVNNGKVYLLKLGTITEIEELSKFAGTNQIIQYYPFCFDQFIMDDGHIYSWIDKDLDLGYAIIE